MLDPILCENARQARDARFDGMFYIGVLTTGVYCRPVCPARLPKAENVRFYPTAAAAAEAGFRPCLRCRPEAAPGTSAWDGTAATVVQALRLIHEGALDGGSVEQLASRLGVGSRHLTRLFSRHLGATPIAVAQTRRLHFAKQLLDATSLSVAEIAFAAGFGSVRRFNAVFRHTYGRSPGALRIPDIAKKSRSTVSARHNNFMLRLAYRPPLPWARMLDYLRLRATPGVEYVGETQYRRTIRLNEHTGSISVHPVAYGHSLELALTFPDPRALLQIVERCRQMFDLNADPTAIANLLGKDSVLAPLVEAQPGLRLPGAWDGFELAVRAILGQQVTVKGATTLAGRLAQAFGESFSDTTDPKLSTLFPTPQILATKNLESIGLPKARGRAIRALAEAVCEGRLCFVSGADPGAFANQLTQLPGIGRWTAEYIVMRALSAPDAFPADDLVLLRAAARLNFAKSPKALATYATAWRPWRAYAAFYLWYSEATSRPADIQAA